MGCALLWRRLLFIRVRPVLLEGDEHAANRFHLEDLAIGLMWPPFNVGIER